MSGTKDVFCAKQGCSYPHVENFGGKTVFTFDIMVNLVDR